LKIQRDYKSIFWILLVTGIILRIIVFLIRKPWSEIGFENLLFEYDAQWYYDQAIVFIQKFDFASLSSLRPPLYTLLLGFSISWFNSVIPVLIFQLLLSIVFIYFSFLFARQIFNEKVGLIYIFLVAIEPHLMFFTTSLNPDFLFITLLLISVNCLFMGLKSFQSKDFVFAGVFLGLAGLTKPIAVYLIFVYLIIAVVYSRKSVIKHIPQYLSLLFVFVLVLSPWFVRNYRLYHEIGFSTVEEYNLMLYAANAQAFAEDKDYDSLVAEYERVVYIKVPDSNAFQSAEMFKTQGLNYFRENKSVFINNHLRGTVNLFINLSPIIILKGLGVKYEAVDRSLKFDGLWENVKAIFRNNTNVIILNLILAIFIGLYYMFALFGIIKLAKKKKYKLLAALLLLILYFIVFIGPAGNAKHKLPITLFYTALSAKAVYEISFLKTVFGKKRILK
jgi:4-amino-4-deoxy-L-arabinose transferase-like glycosyltransferase